MAEASASARMETLHAAIARLQGAGYTADLLARPGGFLADRTGRILPPEELIVDEIVRFEGESDPADEAVLFALRARDGSVRGTCVTTFGPSADPVGAELIRRLDIDEHARRPGARRVTAAPRAQPRGVTEDGV
ncbi:MAG: hypothetical protein ACREI7_08365 [Myxococcota bacterium]